TSLSHHGGLWLNCASFKIFLPSRSSLGATRRDLSLDFSNAGGDICHVRLCAKKDVLRDICDFVRGLICDRSRQHAEILRPAHHEFLHYRLVRHRRLVSAIYRYTLRLGGLEKMLKRQSATIFRMITHDEHVHTMPPDPGVYRQRLKAGTSPEQLAELHEVFVP